MFKRLKNSALHSGKSPVKYKLECEVGAITGLPSTAKTAAISFGRGSKWQAAKDVPVAQGELLALLSEACWRLLACFKAMFRSAAGLRLAFSAAANGLWHLTFVCPQAGHLSARPSPKR